MARDLTMPVQAEAQKPRLIPVYFVHIDYAPDPVYAWTGQGPAYWDAQTWEGAGRLLSFSDVTETVDNRDVGITIELSGIPVDLLSVFSAVDIQGSIACVYQGFLDEVTRQVIADPVQIFGGRVDVPSSIDGEDPRLRVTCESFASAFRRERERRWTGEDQRLEYPGDKGFDYVPQMPGVKLLWGSSGQNGPAVIAPPLGKYERIAQMIRGLW